MAEISEANGNNALALNLKDDSLNQDSACLASNMCGEFSGCLETVPFMQKLMAELVATYLLLFAGFAAMVVNAENGNNIVPPGLAIFWGLDVMVMVYTVGHISGAHFNPAVTIAFATINRFAWKQVPAYISAQVLASTLACGTVRLLFESKQNQLLLTLPAGSYMQSVVIEFMITFYFMFAVTGIATDKRAVGELCGLAVGATVTINSLVGGPISGASMNPARSLGPAIVYNSYKGLWIYILGPTAGAVAGALVYNIMKPNKSFGYQITKVWSCLRKEARIT